MEHCRAVVKVAFIGAGSIEFTRNVVTDLCSYPELAVAGLELALLAPTGPRQGHNPPTLRDHTAMIRSGHFRD